MKLRNYLALRYAGENFSDFMLRRRATNRQDLSRWGIRSFLRCDSDLQQNYVLAEMFAYQVHYTMDQRFGRNWGREGGSYLHDKFLIRGGSLTLDQTMQQGTGEGLNAKYLVTALKARPTVEAAKPVSK